MKYDVNSRDGEPFPLPCHVRDATGAILTPVARCDTETGFAVRYLTTDQGHFATDGNGQLVTVAGKYPAPLTVHQGKPDEHWPDNRAPFPIAEDDDADSDE